MVRNPVVAGKFYPGTALQLRSAIERFIDPNAVKEDAIGLLCPHAGYDYSGPVAGATISRVKIKDTCIILGPNHTGRGAPFSIMAEGSWRTPLGEVQIDSALARQLLAGSKYLKEDALAHQSEHSIEVQVPFLQYFEPTVRIVPIVIAYATGEAYKDLGREIAAVIKQANASVLLLASSDMTHYEPDQAARKKDKQAIEAMLALDENELLRRVEALRISMCGFAPAAVMIAAAKYLGAKSAELVKYQTSGDTSGDRSAVVGYAGIIFTAKEPRPASPDAAGTAAPKPAGMHPIAKLAKEAVESYVKERHIVHMKRLTPEMRQQAGVFVSIHEADGGLRGCIGTFEPASANVAEEIVRNAISSATRDPRFDPVSPEELPNLTYSVDVLTSPEPVADKSQLDPKKYGVIVEAGWRRGLLLPDLEGVDTVDYQIDVCRQKAGIGRSEPVKLYRFEVKRYK